MRVKKLLLLSALSLLLLSAATPPPALAAPSPTTQVLLTFSNGYTLSSDERGGGQVKNGVSYMPAWMVGEAGIKIKWETSGKRAVFSGWEKSFTVQLGSRTGVLDGKKIDIGGIPYMYNKELYIPVKFIVSALEGGPVQWDSKNNVIQATGLHMYRSYSESFGGYVYSVSPDSGELYISSGKNAKRKLASLHSGLDVVDLIFEQTPAGLTLLRVSNNYGEPHIHQEYYTFLLKNGSILRQGHTDFHTTFGDPALWTDGKLVLNDGQTLRLIEDGSGAVSETINLTRLMGSTVTKNVYYNVEAVYPDILLVRPGDTAFLTLVNRSTGAQTVLYKELVDANRQHVLEQTDAMFPGDYIRLTGRSGNTLTFTGYNNVGKDQVYTYTLPAGK
ncbi:copper amine oxidase N-terminal domain-containing protein [Paenibacillus sp. HW567]|uniref:copper amine oxidase N-terminal domain-containing protein n=1 Tax=Paenibacillus sp. HW567 TaxID=1034769 RepID=UPI0005632D40|nr:copper amine oxidase N-terminal domain-containing protein [Paenibacillus sp. HW567]